MAKKQRSPAQKAATRRMLAANRAGKTHHNPTKTYKTKGRRTSHNPVSRGRHKTHRNPSLFGGGGILKELISKEGLLMVAGAMAAPMVTDFLQEKIMPSATGWTKVAVKAGLVAAGAFAIDKFLKMRKVALAYGVTGAAVVASDAVQIARGTMMGLSADEADMVASRPDLVRRIAQGYQSGLADYETGLSEDGGGSFNRAFQPAFGPN